MVAMLNKNLRTVLYYVVTVSVLCLMIEETKRIPDPRTQLSPHYYEVVTASQAELATLPKKTDEREEEDVIPKRNRGRVQKKKIDYYQDNNINDDEKERFREWKKKNKFKPSETGLFRKWKKEIQRGRNKPSRNSKSFESSEDDNELEEEYTEKRGKYKTKHEEQVEDDEDADEIAADDRRDAVDGGEIDTDDLIDYPGGITEYAPAADMSCAEFEVTAELLQRQQSVREACDRLEHEMGPQKLLYSRLRWV